MQAASNDLVFALPTGYIEQRNGEVIILAPATTNERTPCLYGLAGRQPSTGNLEADAEAALVRVVVPGWRRLDDWHYAMRGTSAAGWPYVWYRAAFEGDLGGQRQPVNAMAMVLPAGPGQVHVVWGIGSIARCLLDDVSFEQLFHSLRPPGWTPDGGQALTRALLGHVALYGPCRTAAANLQGRRSLRARSRKQHARWGERADVGERHRGPVHHSRRRAYPHPRSPTSKPGPILRPRL